MKMVLAGALTYRMLSLFLDYFITDTLFLYESLLTLSAMSPAEVTEKLGLHRMRDRSWYVHPSCATSGDGLFEGLNWLSQNAKTK